MSERQPLPSSKVAQDVVWNGGGKEKYQIEYRYSSGRRVTYNHRFNGLLAILKGYYDDSSSNGIREWVEAYMNTRTCPECKGGRLKKELLSVRLEDATTGQTYSIHDIVRRSITDVAALFGSLSLHGRQGIIAAPVIKEIRSRLEFLLNVGLEY